MVKTRRASAAAGALLFLFAIGSHALHKVAEVGYLVFIDFGCRAFLPWEPNPLVERLGMFLASHCMGGAIGYESSLFPSRMMAALIALNYSVNLPSE